MEVSKLTQFVIDVTHAPSEHNIIHYQCSQHEFCLLWHLALSASLPCSVSVWPHSKKGWHAKRCMHAYVHAWYNKNCLEMLVGKHQWKRPFQRQAADRTIILNGSYRTGCEVYRNCKKYRECNILIPRYTYGTKLH